MSDSRSSQQPARITWWVYAGAERIRRTRTMRGTWAYDATCSCGWDTRTGGAVKSFIETEVYLHKHIDHEEQS